MYNVKAVISVNNISEDLKKVIQTYGFVYDFFENQYEKIYEMNSIIEATKLLSGLLEELGIEPYHIEITKLYYNQYFKKNYKMYKVAS